VTGNPPYSSAVSNLALTNSTITAGAVCADYIQVQGHKRQPH
jgi:hypothetical protein